MKAYYYVFFFTFISNIEFLTAIETQFEFKVTEIHRLLVSEKWNCSDVIHYFIERSYEYNQFLNAIINYNPKSLEEAHELDNYYYMKNNRRFIGKLHCIPIFVKDNIDLKGVPTTGGISALRYSIPNIDATTVERLKREGAIVIAKTNLAELVSGKYESELGGMCKNPWDLTRNCGSSSAGYASGITSGLAIVAIGTDTDGTILNPSSSCGVYGLRPAVDEVPSYGIIPAFERQDVVGPLARSMDDLVLTYSILLGRISFYDDYRSFNATKYKVGYLKKFFTSFNQTNQYGSFTYALDPQVNTTMHRALENFESLKFDVVPIEFTEQEFKMFLDLSIFIMIARTTAYDSCIKHAMDRYFTDETRFEFDSPYRSFASLKQSALLKSDWRVYFNSSFMNSSLVECKTKLETYDDYRKKYIEIFESWLQRSDVDVVVFPTANDLADRLNDTEMFSNINPSLISPLLGYPSLNVPIGFSRATKDAPSGLPIGMLMLTRNTNLLKTLKIAKIYEDAYVRVNRLPPTTPKITIEEKCETKLTYYSSSILYKSSVVITTLCILFTNL